jgi:hypothetical protein
MIIICIPAEQVLTSVIIAYIKRKIKNETFISVMLAVTAAG